MPSDSDSTRKQFKQTVNMTASDLENWLKTEQSRDAGHKRGREECTGHPSGRRIVEVLRTKRANLSDDDYAHMRKVVGYAKRDPAQRPHDPTRT